MGSSFIQKTPFYVINKNILDGLFCDLKKALNNNWNNHIIGYSFKTNSLAWLVKYMQKNGCYAETVSADEYEYAKLFNFKEKMIYNGPVKSRETLIEAVCNGCIVNVDSKREITWLIESGLSGKIGIRVNFDLEKYCPGETQCSDEGGRFGFCYENGELAETIKKIQSSNLSLVGVHMHCSSKTRSLSIYKAIAQMCCTIKNEFNLNLEYIDVGGGFFGGVQGKPGFNEYMKCIADTLSSDFDKNKTTLIVEPGMCLVGASVDYITSVVDVKDTTYNRFVVTDGSRTNIDPLMKKTSYSHEIVNLSKTDRIMEKQVICGYTCMENDRLFTLNNSDELCVGDYIIYKKVGAYTMCLTPLFIEFFPDVYLKDGENYTLVRKRWNAEKLMD